MEFPASLRTEFRDLASSTTDRALYSALAGSTPRLLQFFEMASVEETWAAHHLEFFRLALHALNQAYLEGRLGENYALRIVRATEGHFQVLEPALEKNFIFEVQGEEFPVNSIIAGSRSPYLKRLIANAYLEGRQARIKIPTPPLLARYLFSYVETGDQGSIWKWSENDLKLLLPAAELWGLKSLCEECERVLSKYIHKESLVVGLVEAYRKRRHVLKAAHIEMFNRLSPGVQLFIPSEGGLGAAFSDLKEETTSRYKEVKGVVDSLSFTQTLISNPLAFQVAMETPNLSGLDLSKSEVYSSQLLLMLPRIQSLDLSYAGWLHDEEFSEILNASHALKKLSLAQCSMLTYRGLSELKKRPEINSLNLSSMLHLTDRELALAVFPLPHLVELSLKGCKGLSDQALHELARKSPHLRVVDLTRTLVTDDVLIDLGLRCRELTRLTLDHCLAISNRGIAEFLKKCEALTFLSVQDVPLDLAWMEGLRAQFPSIEIH